MTEIKKPESCSHCSKIVQIGNPILRKPATKVENNSVKSDFVQDTVKKLETAIDNYDAVGLAAPQVGIDLKIACVQVTATQLQSHAYENIKEFGMEPVPKTVLINPTLEVINNEKILMNEGCLSVHACEALVPRYKEIKAKFLDKNGEENVWHAKDWTARILQHEISHLNGKLFVDEMMPNTLKFHYWLCQNAQYGHFNKKFIENNVPISFLKQYWNSQVNTQYGESYRRYGRKESPGKYNRFTVLH